MNKKLYLSDVDKKLAGVCGGIAEYFNVDSTIIRIVWALAVFCAGSGLIAYIVCALVIPHRPFSDGGYDQQNNNFNNNNGQYYNNGYENNYQDPDDSHFQ